MPLSFHPEFRWLGHDLLSRVVLSMALVMLLILIVIPAMRMPGFAEDLGLVHDLAARVEQGEMFAALVERWTDPLWGPGSLMWRPWGFTSLMIDAWLWGPVGEYWHLTNLVLHVATAALTGMLAFRLTGGSQLAAAVAASVFLVNPWIGETTFWLVGRFDGWATFFSMAALLSLTGKLPSLRGTALSLLFASAALLSKESSLLLPALVAIVLLAARHPWPVRTMLGVVAVHSLVVASYLLTRYLVLGTFSTAAYGQHGSDVLGLPHAMLRHLGALFPLNGWGGPALAGLLLSVYLGLYKSKSGAGRQTVALTVWLLMVLAAVATFSERAIPFGEGMRFYHLGLPAISCIYGIGLVIAWSHYGYGTRGASLFLGLLAAAWLAGSVGVIETSQRWKSVGREIVSTAHAVAKVARHHQQDRGYGLVILPDNLKPVPTLRAAQGGIVYLAQRLDPLMPRRGLDFVVGMTDQQIDEWHRILNEPVVSRLTERRDAPPRPTLFWCVNDGAALALGYWPHEPLASWRAEWKDKLSRSCPKLTAPI